MTLSPPPGADGVRLTKGERELLDLAAIGEIEVSVNHPAAKTLADAGLLTLGGSSFGRGGGLLYGRFAKITAAGRDLQAALSTPPKENDR